MFETIERPRAGQQMRAAWGARLADRVNELCAAVAPGTLARDGIGGFSAEPIPASHRQRRGVAASIPAGVFEPVFAERDKEGGNEGEKEVYLSGVGPGLFPYGRNFYSGVTFSDSAKVAEGFIGIRITHRGNSSAVSARIVKISDSLSAVVQPSNADGRATTVLPLYTISEGKITCDCRCLMSLAVRE